MGSYEVRLSLNLMVGGSIPLWRTINNFNECKNLVQLLRVGLFYLLDSTYEFSYNTNNKHNLKMCWICNKVFYITNYLGSIRLRIASYK